MSEVKKRMVAFEDKLQWVSLTASYGGGAYLVQIVSGCNGCMGEELTGGMLIVCGGIPLVAGT